MKPVDIDLFQADPVVGGNSRLRSGIAAGIMGTGGPNVNFYPEFADGWEQGEQTPARALEAHTTGAAAASTDLGAGVARARKDLATDPNPGLLGQFPEASGS